jgi:hypothetical protein
MAPHNIDLLIECARANPDAAALRRVATRVANWPAVLDEAGRHTLKPLLHWRLSRLCAGAVPPEVAAHVEEAFHANAARNLMAAAELRKVLGWLEAEGIAVIAFKGPTLAALVYENLALREFNDLDLLVRPRDRHRAVSLLVRNGCRDKGAEGAERLRGNAEIALKTPAGCELDLHWTVSPPYFLPFDITRAWDRVQRVPVAGALLPTFGPDDLFASLAVHGARHCWASLAWICDVANLVRVAPPKWDALLADSRTRRAYSLAAFLAADLLSAPVPAEVVERAATDQVVRALAGQVRAQLFGDGGNLGGTPSEAAMHLRMMTAVRDKVRYVHRRALQPNQTDNDFLPLPRSLRPVLWLVRPFRVLGKLASNI